MAVVWNHVEWCSLVLTLLYIQVLLINNQDKNVWSYSVLLTFCVLYAVDILHICICSVLRS
jgi:hypothetical protein